MNRLYHLGCYSMPASEKNIEYKLTKAYTCLMNL